MPKRLTIFCSKVTNIDPLLKYLSDAVYERADADAGELLTYLRDAISKVLLGYFESIIGTRSAGGYLE